MLHFRSQSRSGTLIRPSPGQCDGLISAPLFRREFPFHRVNQAALMKFMDNRKYAQLFKNTLLMYRSGEIYGMPAKWHPSDKSAPRYFHCYTWRRI